MCLQYAIWAMASIGHDKYDSYSDIFYKRARQYADADEMKVSVIVAEPGQDSWLTCDKGRGRAFYYNCPCAGLGNHRELRSQEYAVHQGICKLRQDCSPRTHDGTGPP